jgi:hypothetical protein
MTIPERKDSSNETVVEPATELSSRPERSVAEGPAVSSHPAVEVDETCCNTDRY